MSPSREFAAAITVPFVACAVLILWLYTGDRDMALTAPYFNANTGHWTYQDSWLTEAVIHKGGRWATVLFAATALGLSLAGSIWTSLRPLRRRAFFVALSIGLATGIVGLLKSVSPDPSPWYSVGFGGDNVHGRLFQSIVHNEAHAGGSPGAHASGAFAMMSLYFVFRERNLRLAWSALGAGFLLGSIFGAAQVVRGAHFPSHNYWSCAIAWLIAVLLYVGPFRGHLCPTPARTDS